MSVAPPERREPIAIVGMSCLFPNAPGLREFWRLIRCGLDGIGDIPRTHWSPADYFDADPKAPDKTYCRRGGFLNTIAFDPSEFGIPPTAIEATDTSQLLGLVVAKAALADAGYDDGRDFNRSRVSVILGVTGTQELVIPLGARLGHPIWRRALRDAGVDPLVADDVVQRIADGYVPWQESSFPGLLGNVVAGRIANRLNLHGTNCAIDAACASSLSALHLAVMELQAGRSDVIVSGGVDTLNDIFMHMCFSKTPALSPTGDARPFAADADGTVLGEGIGLLVLKRLTDAQRDGDRVYAVIRAVGTSSDGRQNSIYAPFADGQARAIRRAYELAGFEPDTVELVEAHGTGTKVGDVVEVEALRAVFQDGAKEKHGEAWCALGSVKSQIGHTKAAAGAAGLIKAALALHSRTLPPTAKLREPNPKLQLDDSPFYVNTAARPWLPRGDHPRRASVSSFGFGGSNFHVLLEEAPPVQAPLLHGGDLSPQPSVVSPSPVPAWDGSVELIALSNETPAALAQALDEWRTFADGDMTWPQLSGRAAQSRASFSASHAHRLVLVLERPPQQGVPPGSPRMRDPAADVLVDLIDRARKQLSQRPDGDWTLPGVYHGVGAQAGKLAFLFPGQGSQYLHMGRELMCLFREALEAMHEADGDGLTDRIYPPAAFDDATRAGCRAELTRTDVAQPAIGAVCVAMWRVLERFGLRADAVAGHSYGELVALHAGGRFDAQTLHKLSRLRGRAMAGGAAAQQEVDRGTMAAVEAPLDDVVRMIDEDRLDVVLANRNAPAQGVLSGRTDAIRRALDACRLRGYRTKELPVAGAFHSRLMSDAHALFRRELIRSVTFADAALPVFANSTGRPYPTDPADARELLAGQMIRPVDFVAQVENLYHMGVRTFVEVGPKAVLAGLVRSILSGRGHWAIATDASAGQRSGLYDLARVLAQLAALGYRVRLDHWEQPPAETRKPRMVVPLVGANYRSEDRKPHRPAVRSARTADRSPPDTAPRAIEPQAAIPAAASIAAQDDVMKESNGDASSAQHAMLIDALRVVQDGLHAMQTLQQQTAEAHRRFLEGQEQAHRTFQAMMEGQQRLFERVLGMAPSQPAESVAPVAPREARPISESTAATARAPAHADIAPPVAERAAPAPSRIHRAASEVAQADWLADADPFASQSAPPNTSSRFSTVHDAPSTPPATRAAGDADRFSKILLDVVAELTGYPVEMVNLDMDLEADLGIDSIKRVEILAAVQAKAPEYNAVNPEYMGSLRTLRQIVDYSTGAQGSPRPTEPVAVAAGNGEKKKRAVEPQRPSPAHSPAG